MNTAERIPSPESMGFAGGNARFSDRESDARSARDWPFAQQQQVRKTVARYQPGPAGTRRWRHAHRQGAAKLPPGCCELRGKEPEGSTHACRPPRRGHIRASPSESRQDAARQRRGPGRVPAPARTKLLPRGSSPARSRPCPSSAGSPAPGIEIDRAVQGGDRLLRPACLVENRRRLTQPIRDQRAPQGSGDHRPPSNATPRSVPGQAGRILF